MQAREETRDHLFFALQTFNEVNRIITSSHDSDETLARIASMIADRIRVDACSIYIYDADQRMLTMKATHGLNPASVENIRIRPNEGLVGLVLENATPVQEAKMHEHPRFKPYPQSNEDSFSSFLGVPLIEHRKEFGVLVVHTIEPRKFEAEEVQILSSIATQISSLVSKVLLLKQLDIAAEQPSLAISKKIGPSVRISGQPVANGIAIGKAVLLQQSDITEPQKESTRSVDEEMADFQAALDHTISDTMELIETVSDRVGAEEASIFHAHIMFLEDHHFQDKIKIRIESRNTASWSIFETVNEYLRAFEGIADPYLSEKGTDLKDVGYRLLHYLGHEVLSVTEKAGVLVVRQLLPGDIARLDTTRIKGIVMSSGGVVSHAAILARSLMIPAICVEEEELDQIRDGNRLVLDGDSGYLVIEPRQEILEEFKRLLFEHQQHQENLSKLRDQPCVTKDGTRIHVMANVALESDVQQLPVHGAEGVGLYRTEIYFLSLDRYPEVFEQMTVYRTLMENVPEDQPIIFRTLDVGADKAAPYMGFQHEDNPFLGFRAVRRQLKKNKILKEQLHALLMAAGKRKNIKLLFPMITNLQEVRQVKALFQECRMEMEAAGQEAPMFEIGIMFEVPSSVLLCEKFLPEIDFCSIGSNDLTQYVLAVDRNNPQTADLYDPLHPAVLWMIKKLVDQANMHNKPLELCGEMASDPDGCVILAGLGLRSFSMNAPLIPVVKERLAEITLEDAEEAAEQALNMTSPAEVRKLIRKRFPIPH